MIKILSLVLAVLMTSCVSTYMRQYIGEDIREVMMTEGQPIHVFPVGDNQMAYQYIFGRAIGATGGSARTKTTTTTQTGAEITTTSETDENDSAVYSSGGCVVTYLARKHGEVWIVEDIRYPSGLVC